MKRALGSLVVAIILVGTSACGSSPSTTKPSVAHQSADTRALAAPPTVGACRNLTFAAAAASSNSTPVVPCTTTHTAVTVAVGSLVDKNHPTLTNVNSPAVQQRLAVTCPTTVKAYAGGGRNTFELSLVKAVWFLPTQAQFDAGAHWYRCDLIALSSANQLAPLAGKMRRALDPARALNRWGLCSNAAPSASNYRWAACAQRHRWRAVAVVNLPRKAVFMSKSAGAAAVKDCGTIAANDAAGKLKYTWSFEWPNRQQWQAGQRYGWCWLPKSN